MTLITIDQDRCTQDSHCIAECPARIILMIDNTPTIPVEVEESCIDCGHCVAVCPSGALTLKNLGPEECLPMDKSLALSEEHVEHFLRSRRSIRTFKNKAVPRGLLQKVIDVARCAPTASNKQPVHWLVLQKEEEIKMVTSMVIDWVRVAVKVDPDPASEKSFERIIEAQQAGIDRICRGAQNLVFCYADKTLASAETDCAIALTYLELALPAFGLGDCWGGYVIHACKWWAPLKAYLNIPEEMDVFSAALVGYPKYRFHRMPERNPVKVEWR